MFSTHSVKEGLVNPVCSRHLREKPKGTYLRLIQEWRKLILEWREPNAENCLILNMTFLGSSVELSRRVPALSPQEVEEV